LAVDGYNKTDQSESKTNRHKNENDGKVVDGVVLSKERSKD
jgi:hypothetical protein